MTTVPLNELAQRITDEKATLAALRREYQERRAQLQELTRRKKELEGQLGQVDKEIATLTAGSSVPQRAGQEGSGRRQTKARKRRPKASQPRLADLIVDIIGATGRPMTASRVAEELRRRQFRSASTDLTKMVQTRIHDLTKQGLLRHAGDQPGVVLARASQGLVAPSAQRDGGTKKRAAGKNGRPQRAAARDKDGRRAGKVPFATLLTDLMAQSDVPLSAAELASRAIKAGYRSKSKDLKAVVWATMAKLKKVENVPGQGYRLKSRA